LHLLHQKTENLAITLGDETHAHVSRRNFNSKRFY